MKFHSAIRKEVLAFIAETVPNIKNFYNGIPNIRNIESELPLICVHLDNAEVDPAAVGFQEWEADLNIGIFVPFDKSEEYLDEIANEVYEQLLTHQFKTILRKQAQRYEYDYDDDKVWVSSAISFRINYNFEAVNLYLRQLIEQGYTDV